METGITSSSRPRYGALELKQTYQQGLGWALFIAVAMHLAAIEGTQIYQRLTREETPPALPILRTLPMPRLHVEPGYKLPPPPPPGTPPAKFKEAFKIGIPRAAGEVLLEHEDVMATRLDILKHLMGVSGPDGQSGDTTGAIGLPGIPEAELYLPEPTEYVFVTREAQALPNQMKPRYPEFAELAGLDWKGMLRVLVGPQGDVLKVLVVNPTDDDAGFEAAAVAAAWTWRYIPALQNDRPVAVWVNVPVNFRLR